MNTVPNTVLILSFVSIAGCTSELVEPTASSGEDLVTLTAASCGPPRVVTTPHGDSAGRAIAGTAHTTLSGCILGAPGQTGASLVTRLTTVLGDVNRFALVEDASGGRVFTRFAAQPPTGTLASGLVQDVDVVLALNLSPRTRIRVTRTLLPGGGYRVHLVNVTPVVATAVLIPITAIRPGNLSVTLDVRPATNGVIVDAVGDVALEVQKSEVGQTSELVTDVFHWLASELASG